jgi:hypothetical protein
MAIFDSSDVWRDQTLVGSSKNANFRPVVPQSTDLNGAFLGYMAGLSDSKQFALGAGMSTGENHAFVTSGELSPTFANNHHQ